MQLSLCPSYVCVKLDCHLVVVKLHSINIIIKELLSSKHGNSIVIKYGVKGKWNVCLSLNNV